MDRKTAIFSALGFEIVGIIIAAVYIGAYIDEKYKWNGLGLIGAIALGFIGWFVHVLLVVSIVEKRDQAEESKKNRS